MRGIVVAGCIAVGCIALVIATRVAAAPSKPPPPTWADWVGDYEGTLVWRSCTTAGAGRATIALDAVDGAMGIDLAPAGRNLTWMSLVGSDRGWTGRDGEVQARIERPGPDRVYLEVAFDAGCTLRANLRRSTTKIAACDRLVGWARIERGCRKSAVDPKEPWSALVEERATWKPRARGVVARCTKRAAAVEAAMIDVGCAPADASAGAVMPNCTRAVATAARLRRCGRHPDVAQRIEDMVLTIPTDAPLDAFSRSIAEEQCARIDSAMIQVGQQYRCP